MSHSVCLSGPLPGKSHHHRSVIEMQGFHRLEKYLNLEGLHEKSLKIENALKSS